MHFLAFDLSFMHLPFLLFVLSIHIFSIKINIKKLRKINNKDWLHSCAVSWLHNKHTQCISGSSVLFKVQNPIILHFSCKKISEHPPFKSKSDMPGLKASPCSWCPLAPAYDNWQYVYYIANWFFFYFILWGVFLKFTKKRCVLTHEYSIFIECTLFKLVLST